MSVVKRLTKIISNSVQHVALGSSSSSDADTLRSTLPTYDTLTLSAAGLPGDLTCHAYDSVLGILVVGTQMGTLHVLGRNDLELVVRLDGRPSTPNDPTTKKAAASSSPASRSASPVSTDPPSRDAALCGVSDVLSVEAKYVAVQPGTGRIAVVDGENMLHVYHVDATTGGLIMVKKLRIIEGTVITMEMDTGSPWLYLGCHNGRVAVVSIETAWKSSYLIQSLARLPMSPVVALGVHPHSRTTLLIAYYDGSVVTWDLTSKQVLQQYDAAPWAALTPANTYPVHATCGVWHPDGRAFALGFDNGWVCLWETAQRGMVASYALPDFRGSDMTALASDEYMASSSPPAVFKMQWFLETRDPPAADRTTLVVAGGVSESALVLIDIPRNETPKSVPPLQFIRHSPGYGTILDFDVMSVCPWQLRNPKALLCMTRSGTTFAYLPTGNPPRLQRLALPLTLSLACLGQINVIHQTAVPAATMNELMDLAARSATLQSPVPLAYNTSSATTVPSSAPTSPTSPVTAPRVPDHALLLATCSTGAHVLDLTPSPPAMLAPFSVQFELIKAVLIDHLPDWLQASPSDLAAWYPGLTLAWATVDWSSRKLVLGCANGTWVEMICRQYLFAGSEGGATRRVRIRSMDEMHLDLPPPPLPPRASAVDIALPDSPDSPDSRRMSDPAPGEVPKGAQWIPITLSEPQFRAFDGQVFLPYKVCIPAPAPALPKDASLAESSLQAAISGTLLAVADAACSVALYDLRTESHISTLDLASMCADIAQSSTPASSPLRRLRTASMGASPSTSSFDRPACQVTVLKWYRTVDDVVMLFIGCNGHVFVYVLDDEVVELETVLRDKDDVPILDLLMTPDTAAAPQEVPEPVPLTALAKRESKRSLDDVAERGGGGGSKSGSSGSLNARRSRRDIARSAAGANAILEPTCLVVTRDSVRLLDLDDFRKLHSWKPDLDRHGHILAAQIVKGPAKLTDSGDGKSTRASSRTRTGSGNVGVLSSHMELSGSTAGPENPVLVVVTDVTVVILSFPGLEFLTDMSSPVIANPDGPTRLAVTRDGHLVHVAGANRVMTVATLRDTAWLAQPTLVLPTDGGTPLPPRPVATRASSPLGTILSYLGGSSGAAAVVPEPTTDPAAAAAALAAAFGAVPAVASAAGTVPRRDRTSSSGGTSPAAAAAEAGNVFQKAKDGLSERGERLEKLEEKFADLAVASSNFADMAKQIRQKQEAQSRRWFPFG
ncbi:hypothetical protein AMAG_07015 [Allomyces macrogynus ATCC 38327]|uniref:V-SNARE coiled-coil homology domain-containing protein n=1 Tax=Allomyces macrogynus (strain ATCC 38327) TaxID=578462 RepID=A0A0L0SFP1_ALLM3|nr:hypothetical protein AMAG_07015 [Allomyces macrogynus ATCC 38327]|eukprot:KNE61272.1 hypothetical protein AMAG_07015 [Allomyces macrogynus ATCC 38327]